MKTTKKLTSGDLAPLFLVITGAILLVYMIVVEDEPGAVPLLFIIGGGLWYFLRRAFKRVPGRTE